VNRPRCDAVPASVKGETPVVEKSIVPPNS
jgi:hypothetical protein